jgi:CDP-paratose 2-epimerase
MSPRPHPQRPGGGASREVRLQADRAAPDDRPVLITGGAGFVATNVAHRILCGGRPVIVFDNLSRSGVEQNLEWLRDVHGDLVRIHIGDVRDPDALAGVVRQARQVYHFAAQVAVTTSLSDPFHDFEVNARGTLNLLEAVRSCDRPPSVLFTSTNKVYGDLEDVGLRQARTRYEPASATVRQQGISETRCLEFHSPYGCSKGVAEQYVLDYARTFGLRTVVFRMSCIYGPHQFGTEDQGWVAHFLIAALRGEPLAIYGDGLQVRDILFVDDLVDAMLIAQERIDTITGEAFNIGGGPDNTISLVELLDLIGSLTGRRPSTSRQPWRTADQRYYVSDTRKFRQATGWRPGIGVRDGVAALLEWLIANRVAVPVVAAGRVAS